MGKKRAYKSRKPGGGRKKLKPEYDAGKNLKEQMESAVALHDSKMSLQAIGEELGLNPIKVRKLLITADVYESEVAEKVNSLILLRTAHFGVYRLPNESYNDFKSKIEDSSRKYTDLSPVFEMYSNFANSGS